MAQSDSPYLYSTHKAPAVWEEGNLKGGVHYVGYYLELAPEEVKPGQEVSGLIVLIPILLLLALSFLFFFLLIFRVNSS